MENKENNNVLWLEDQYEDFDAHLSALDRADFTVDTVKSVSEVVEKLRTKNYCAVIFDIKVLPGNDPRWLELDKRKRDMNPNFDSHLGLELLHSLLAPESANVKLDPPILINPRKIIVFSVVYDKSDEIAALGVPGDQIIYKSNSTLKTLPRLIKKIQEQESGEDSDE